MKVMYLRNESNLKNTFYLLDQHLQVYGIQYEMKITPHQKKESKKSKTRVYTTVRKKDIDAKDHEIVKSINNPIDDNPLKTLPRRFDEHLKYLRNDGSKVICIACKEGGIIIPKNQIKKHLILSSHLDSTKLESFSYMFFCEICDLKFYDEMTWDMHFEKIPEKHKNTAASRRENICEHECLTCKVILYGDALSLRRHRNSNTRRIERSRGSFLSEETKKYFSSKTIINENGQQLLDDVKEVLDEQECILECCRDLEDALSGYFRDCEAHPFGSRISGLGNSDSDLDVFIDIGDMYDGVKKQSEKNQKKIINIAMELFKNKEEFYRITSRPSARTPIIRLKHKPTELDCDISFRHGLSVENTKFLKFCFQLQPISQTLILVIKKWSHLCVLHENITTYAMAMLTIFYLQTEKYLLSVDTVKTLNPTESRVIDGWDTITYTAPIEEVRQHIAMYKGGDIVILLKGFFKYYSDFNYKAHVICPLLGTTVLKSQFTEDLTGSLLPEEMKSYINKINKEENPEYFRSLSEFCIQDPFDLSHNLTKACSPTFVEKFKHLCTLTYEMLEKL
ncbi:hypothetical protein WA026_014020 [Henosepilachna vigintioctopunctata]|uniref:Uncharacterized protein n=1 Tax=Henosepilachna vigintioctopunctata TaxID=420089 RepID=A0AAW1TYG8_9CUCU